MNTEALFSASEAKKMLQQLLNRSIPKPTLQRWRKAANVKLLLDKEKNIYFYTAEDLNLIYLMVNELKKLPNKKKTLDNAFFEAYKKQQGEN